jgi:hypothetical protein
MQMWQQAEEALKEMKEQKRRGKASFWKELQLVIEDHKGERLCWLQCIKEGVGYERLLSTLNPGG